MVRGARGWVAASSGLGAAAAVFVYLGCASVPVKVPVRFGAPVEGHDAVIPGLVACDEGHQPARVDPQRPVHILVHGTNSSNERFATLAEVFESRGQQAVCFTYDDRESLDRSSARLAKAIEALQAQVHPKEVVVLGHSQGGLISRRALIRDRLDGIQLDADESRIHLVTVATPFGGIRSARNCGSVVRHVVSLGLTTGICHIVAGPKWLQIHPASRFIQAPGRLDEHVVEHLKINTDERGTCAEYRGPDRCVRSDEVFHLEEQFHEPVDSDERVKNETVRAGHSDVVGENGHPPMVLVELLQRHGVLAPPPAGEELAAGVLLHQLFVPHVFASGSQELE